jgi:hypothetical protein
VDVIKIKFVSLTLLFLIISFIFVLYITSSCIAEEAKGVHFVGEPSYKLTNTIIRNNRIIGKTYEIHIKMHNSGLEKSEILIVNLSDEDSSLKQEVYFEKNETKTISFIWSTVKISDQRLHVHFYPKDLETVQNEFNSGSLSFIIEISDNEDIPATSTPGFQALFIFLLISILILYKKVIPAK